jgi:hypothetical protein
MRMCIYVLIRTYKRTGWADDLSGFRNGCSKEVTAVQKENLHHRKSIFGKGEGNGITLVMAARGADCLRGSKMAAEL